MTQCSAAGGAQVAGVRRDLQPFSPLSRRLAPASYPYTSTHNKSHGPHPRVAGVCPRACSAKRRLKCVVDPM